MAKIDRVQEVSLDLLKPYENNAKVHSQDQVSKIADSIREFGFLSPCLIDKDYNIIAGHGRVMAAKKLGMESVPCVFIEGLTDAQRRAYILADNRLTELGGWDEYLVQQELKALDDEGFNIDLTGFELELDDDSNKDDISASINLTETLPDSKVYIYSVSAFGTGSEKIVMIKLSQETANHVLQAIDEKDTDDLVAELVGALNAL